MNKKITIIDASAKDINRKGKEINVHVGGALVDVTQLLAWVVLSMEEEYEYPYDVILSTTKRTIQYIKERGYDQDE